MIIQYKISADEKLTCKVKKSVHAMNYHEPNS